MKSVILFPSLIFFLLVPPDLLGNEMGINIDFGYKLIDVYQSEEDAAKRSYALGFSRQFTRSRGGFEMFWNNCVNVSYLTLENFREGLERHERRDVFPEEIYNSEGWGVGIKEDLTFRIYGMSNLRLYFGPAAMLNLEHNTVVRDGWKGSFEIGFKLMCKYLTMNDFYYAISIGHSVSFESSNNLNNDYGTVLISTTITRGIKIPSDVP